MKNLLIWLMGIEYTSDFICLFIGLFFIWLGFNSPGEHVEETNLVADQLTNFLSLAYYLSLSLSHTHTHIYIYIYIDRYIDIFFYFRVIPIRDQLFTKFIYPAYIFQKFFVTIDMTFCLVGWDCRILRLHLCRGVRPHNECPGYDTK